MPPKKRHEIKVIHDETAVVAVNTRLFRSDVEELKRRAAEQGFLEWQPFLRKLVHEALHERKIVR